MSVGWIHVEACIHCSVNDVIDNYSTSELSEYMIHADRESLTIMRQICSNKLTISDAFIISERRAVDTCQLRSSEMHKAKRFSSFISFDAFSYKLPWVVLNSTTLV